MRYVAALRRIANRLTSQGFDVIAVPGWETRGADDLGPIMGFILHHDASSPKSTEDAGWRTIAHGRRDLAGPLSQWYLARSGRIYLVAAGRANHAGKVRSTYYDNDSALGVEAANNGVGEPWPDHQLNAYVALTRENLNEFALSANRAAGHREICSPVGRKIDPTGIDLNAFRVRVAAPREVPPPPPVEQTTPFESPEDAMYALILPKTPTREFVPVPVPPPADAQSLGPKGRVFVSLRAGRPGAVLHRIVLAGPGHWSEHVKEGNTPLTAGQPLVIEIPEHVVQVEVEYSSPAALSVLVEPIPATA